MPCSFSCQSSTWPGPPQARSSLPLVSNSITGGAGTQHLVRGGLKLAAFSSSVSVRGRWITQTLSSASTATPAACPMIQLFGRVCGHDASTLKVGGSAATEGRAAPINTAAAVRMILMVVSRAAAIVAGEAALPTSVVLQPGGGQGDLPSPRKSGEREGG